MFNYEQKNVHVFRYELRQNMMVPHTSLNSHTDERERCGIKRRTNIFLYTVIINQIEVREEAFITICSFKNLLYEKVFIFCIN